jgi:RHH-type rel operon transcriptional repressor/antitoxin RelB
MLTLRLPPELENRLMKVARMTGQTKGLIAREAIITHLDDLEEAYLPRRLSKRGKKPLKGPPAKFADDKVR